jgi:hypothetical protein
MPSEKKKRHIIKLEMWSNDFGKAKKGKRKVDYILRKTKKDD